MRLPSRSTVVLSLAMTWSAAAFGQAAKPVPLGGARLGPETQNATPVVTRVERPRHVPVTTDSAPQPVGFESDVYCFGYIAPPGEHFPVRVHGAENLFEQTDYITDDMLYVDGGYDTGLKVGDQFWIVTPEQDVIHPLTEKSMGRFYQYRGRAVVDSVEARTAIVRVTSACSDIPMFASLKRFEPIPIPLVRKSPMAKSGDLPSGKAKGRIVFSKDGVVALGADQMVIVDLGAADGLQPGDFVTLFRYSSGREYGIKAMGTYWVTLPPPPGVSIPRTYLGEGAVLNVGDRWSVVRLTDSNRMLQVGDEVELK
ncbi:MAG: hypothetical protein LC796_13350 [Acidobacteria bacterium]|nr:hypothetical protein [Acidobacteriota bacterium]